MPFLTVVLPAFNEADNLPKTIESVHGYLRRRQLDAEILVVDDGSTDRTAEVLERLRGRYPELRVLRHPVNRGYGAALRTGFAGSTGEWVHLMDSDGQFDIADLDRFLPLTQGHEAVLGYRLRRQDPFYRRINAWLWGRVVGFILGVRVRDLDCAFKLMDGSLLRRFPLRSDGAGISAELLFMMQKWRVRRVEVGVEHYPRVSGRSTGANPRVILRALGELLEMRRRDPRSEPVPATAPMANAERRHAGG